MSSHNALIKNGSSGDYYNILQNQILKTTILRRKKKDLKELST
jgi:hypothetical protein